MGILLAPQVLPSGPDFAIGKSFPDDGTRLATLSRAPGDPLVAPAESDYVERITAALQKYESHLLMCVIRPFGAILRLFALEVEPQPQVD